MTYQPDYAEGEIVVSFRTQVSNEFANDFGKLVGYKLKNKSRFYRDCFVYQTEEGGEDKAVKKFSVYLDIVDWANLRDLNLESRWNGLEQIINSLRILQDTLEVSDEEYIIRINEICDSLREVE
nr:hypothetical protein [Nanoarchaeum sp.]